METRTRTRPAAAAPTKGTGADLFCRHTAFKVTPKGPLLLDFEPTRIYALRPRPARAWVISRTASNRSKPVGKGDWRGIRDPAIDVSSLIREVRSEDGFLTATGTGYGGSPPEVWRRTNFRKFLEHVPTDVQDICAAGFTGGTWPLFRLLQNVSETRDVAQSNDGGSLVFALAMAHRLLPETPFDKRPPDTLRLARRLIKRPRKEILGALGFPAQNASVTALAKIPRAHLEVTTLHLLRDALNHPTAQKKCWHLPRLPWALLAVLQPDILPFAGPGLIAGLVNSNESKMTAEHLASDIRDSAILAASLGKTAPVFESPEHVKHVHDALVIERRVTIKQEHTVFPTSRELSLVLTADERAFMRRLGSHKELLSEGTEMQHCLGTMEEHVQLARQGMLHVFAVEENERLTLALINWKGAWGIYDFRGYGNEEPSKDAMAWGRALIERLENARAVSTQHHPRSQTLGPQRTL